MRTIATVRGARVIESVGLVRVDTIIAEFIDFASTIKLVIRN